MKTWEITDNAAFDNRLLIEADTFDEALAKARKINPKCNAGRLAARYFVIMQGTTGTFKTECQTLSEAIKLRDNNCALGYDARIKVE